MLIALLLAIWYGFYIVCSFVDPIARESQQSSAHSNGAELPPRMTTAQLPSEPPSSSPAHVKADKADR